MYERQGNVFVEVARLMGDLPGASIESYAAEIALQGTRLLVPARGDNDLATEAGAVYIYERNPAGAWLEVQKLYSPTPATRTDFGAALAVQNDELYVTQIKRTLPNTPGVRHGSIHRFEHTGSEYVWVQEIAATLPQTDSNLGQSLAVDGEYLAACAPRENFAGTDSGVVHVFGPGEVGVASCVANTNSSGAPGELRVRACGPLLSGFELHARDLAPSEFGYFLMSDTQSFLPLFGGSEGNLCLGLPLVRFSMDILNSGAQGAVSFTPDLANLPGPTTLGPGETWTFQYWFRDGALSNTTDAVAITFETARDPSVQLPVALGARSEEAESFVIPVTLSQATTSSVSVPYTVAGTATLGVDFQVTSTNPLVIATGDTSAAITVTLLEDSDLEPTETIVVSLDPPTGAVLGTQTSHTTSILDDD
ncbi:MAG: hypothetical protein GY711_26180 [bacterium]|nr:hypothetical protein [bacterium]